MLGEIARTKKGKSSGRQPGREGGGGGATAAGTREPGREIAVRARGAKAVAVG
jgi:hypothetical protein